MQNDSLFSLIKKGEKRSEDRICPKERITGSIEIKSSNSFNKNGEVVFIDFSSSGMGLQTNIKLAVHEIVFIHLIFHEKTFNMEGKVMFQERHPSPYRTGIQLTSSAKEYNNFIEKHIKNIK